MGVPQNGEFIRGNPTMMDHRYVYKVIHKWMEQIGHVMHHQISGDSRFHLLGDDYTEELINMRYGSVYIMLYIMNIRAFVFTHTFWFKIYSSQKVSPASHD